MTKKLPVSKLKRALKTPPPAPKITYQKLFWLFVVGSLLGVVIEGFFCYSRKGHWETHVVSMWGPFCILYGIGAVLFYTASALMWRKNLILQLLVIGIIADVIELAAGLLLEFGLKMRAWSYLGHLLNIRGHISMTMTFGWGILGVAFSFLIPPLEKIFAKMQHRAWKVTCLVLTVFMAVNLTFTAVCIVRWKDRHFGVEPRNAFERWIDTTYDDEYMQHRFIEWRFLE